MITGGTTTASAYIDTKTFADYRTEYFKGDKQIKVIDRDWVPLGGSDDPRAVGWGYWYGKTLATNHETWAVIPAKVNQVDGKYKKNWWSKRRCARSSVDPAFRDLLTQ